MASPNITTRDRWNFDGPYYIARRGSRTVPDRFLKNVEWRDSEGGYCVPDLWIEGHYIKVEFSPHALCWGEVRYLTRDDEFEEGIAEWEIFRPFQRVSFQTSVAFLASLVSPASAWPPRPSPLSSGSDTLVPNAQACHSYGICPYGASSCPRTP